MANEEHLAILKQGVKAWNQWRKENRGVVPDLSYGNLSNANLSGANLMGSDLRGATLIGSELVEANLLWANLRGTTLSLANLRNVYLREAHLNNADLTRADLRGANLTGVDLSGARFIETHLSHANLKYAGLSKTSFSNMDLSDVKGLEHVKHDGRSFIDIHTIYLSKGNISQKFLRGIGVPDVFIEYMGSLVGRPIEYYSCFISYSSKDQALAERLHADLQNNGVRCWFAPHDLRIGSKYKSGIDEAIRFHDKLLLILSDNAIESGWVEHEVEKALEKERETAEYSLFPIRIDDTVMEVDSGWAGHIRQERHIGDFRNWKSHDAYQEVFQRLLRDLKTDQRAPTPAAVFTTLHRAQETAELDPQRTRLLQLIAQHFTSEELRTLCFQLSVDYDELPGETKTAKIRELILHFERQRPGGAGTLAEYVRDKRPSAFN